LSISSTRDGRRTSDIGIQVQVSNRFKRLLSKAVVVSVEESQNKSGEVGIGKTNETEPLLSHRKALVTSKPWLFVGTWDQSAKNLIIVQMASGVQEA